MHCTCHIRKRVRPFRIPSANVCFSDKHKSRFVSNGNRNRSQVPVAVHVLVVVFTPYPSEDISLRPAPIIVLRIRTTNTRSRSLGQWEELPYIRTSHFWLHQNQHHLLRALFDGMYSLTIPALGVLAIIVLCVWPGVASTRSKARRKLPPGPPRLPFVGSLFHLPKDHDWLVYEQWGKKYGAYLQPYTGHLWFRGLTLMIELGSDLVHIDVLSSNIFVVNSAKAANELFEKRSSKYSDR